MKQGRRVPASVCCRSHVGFLGRLALPRQLRTGKNSSEAAADPILRALQAELTRSKAQLKMDNIGAPFYIEYRVFDVDQFEASAAFGACGTKTAAGCD
jgi:hypothetical protein